MFNTYSRGPTHWSLTDTDEDYNLEGVDFPHHTLHPSQPKVLCFPTRAPIRSPVYKILPTLPKFRFKEPMAATWPSDHSTIYRGLHLHIAKASDLPLAIGLIRMDRKVMLIKLGHQSNSYNLMHIQKS
jgi:hypothetical protein